MKFFVQVNIKYLVSLEAESALYAEHMCLDLDGVWGACAFDDEGRKTETFRGVLLEAMTISFTELVDISGRYTEAAKAAASAKAAVATAAEAQDQAMYVYDEAKRRFRDSEKAYYERLRAMENAQAVLGANRP